MVDIISCSWASILLARRVYLAWHCRVTIRQVTEPVASWERKGGR
jgi:hypothetical protein